MFTTLHAKIVCSKIWNLKYGPDEVGINPEKIQGFYKNHPQYEFLGGIRDSRKYPNIETTLFGFTTTPPNS